MELNQQLDTIYDLLDQNNYIEAWKQLKEIDEEKLNKDEKLELLQTKAEFFSKTLETEELLKTKEEIIKLLEKKIKIIEKINPPSIDITKDLTSDEIVWEIDISEIAKKISYSIKKEVSTKILNSLIERFMLNQQEWDLEEYENITTMYFQEIEYLKKIWESWEWFFMNHYIIDLNETNKKKKKQ